MTRRWPSFSKVRFERVSSIRPRLRSHVKNVPGMVWTVSATDSKQEYRELFYSIVEYFQNNETTVMCCG